MYVCLCHAVTDRQLRRAIRTGEVASVRDMQKHLKVATQCGKCACDARALLKRELEAQDRTSPGLWSPADMVPGAA